MGDRSAKIQTARENAAYSVLRFATETTDEKRGVVALAGAYLLNENDPRFDGVGASVAVLEAAALQLSRIYAEETPSTKLALGALTDAERALSSLRALLAEVSR